MAQNFVPDSGSRIPMFHLMRWQQELCWHIMLKSIHIWQKYCRNCMLNLRINSCLGNLRTGCDKNSNAGTTDFLSSLRRPISDRFRETHQQQKQLLVQTHSRRSSYARSDNGNSSTALPWSLCSHLVLFTPWHRVTRMHIIS